MDWVSDWVSDWLLRSIHYVPVEWRVQALGKREWWLQERVAAAPPTEAHSPTETPGA